jgi:imidazolonepropionase-like amidohydrolase
VQKALFPALALATLSAAHADPIYLQGARLIDGTGKPPIEQGAIVLDGERIVAVGEMSKVRRPPKATVVDLKGRTIMPGLINAHGHVGLVEGGKNSAEAYTRANVLAQLAGYARYGVTSVLALGLNRDLGYEIRDEQRRSGIPGASLFVAGRGIGVPDAAPPVPVAADQVYRPKTVEEARADVRETAAHHADILKLWVDDIYGRFPRMAPPIFQAAIDEAHRLKLRVAAHVFYLADAKALAASGIDAFAHSIRDQEVDAELIAAMKAKGIFYVPTFTVDESAFIFAEDPSLIADPLLVAAVDPATVDQLRSEEYRAKVAADPNTPKIKAALATGMLNLKALHDAGARIAFGTDSGAQPVRIPGWAEHRELMLMVRAGLTPLEAITAATSGSAAMLGVTDRGVLAKGKRADLIVLGSNPLDDIRNTRQLVAVWLGGRKVEVPAQAH